jgi:hypothetical protein
MAESEYVSIKPLCDLCIKMGILCSTMKPDRLFGPDGKLADGPAYTCLNEKHSRTYHPFTGYISRSDLSDAPNLARYCSCNLACYIAAAKSIEEEVTFRCPGTHSGAQDLLERL